MLQSKGCHYVSALICQIFHFQFEVFHRKSKAISVEYSVTNDYDKKVEVLESCVLILQVKFVVFSVL